MINNIVWGFVGMIMAMIAHHYLYGNLHSEANDLKTACQAEIMGKENCIMAFVPEIKEK